MAPILVWNRRNHTSVHRDTERGSSLRAFTLHHRAGTMVIKEKNYRKIHVSLDEFDYLTKNYHPTYPQSADLSLEQVNVITRTLESGEKDRVRRVTLLAKKVQEILSVTPRENNQEKFLQTVLRDYQYYALEEI